MKNIVLNVVAIVACSLLAGCQAGSLVGGMMQNAEYQKKIEVLAKYDGLQNKTVAVVVNTDMTTRYEHPRLAEQISAFLAQNIQSNVAGVQVVAPNRVLKWQYDTPQWETLPYGDVIEQLRVDRVVYVDVYEYRLHPPGNSWQWQGVLSANVGILERDGIVPDLFADEYPVVSEFPPLEYVGRENANRQQIELGLMKQFIERAGWLFYKHIEPKYPDKYRPELDRT